LHELNATELGPLFMIFRGNTKVRLASDMFVGLKKTHENSFVISRLNHPNP
jgi:hypothetical protein